MRLIYRLSLGTVLLAGLSCIHAPVFSATLEQRIEKLEKKVKRNKTSLERKIEKAAERSSIKGFLTAGLATQSGEGTLGLPGNETEISDDLCFHCDSLVGIQMDFALGEQYGAITQIIGNGGGDKFDLNGEWAYLYYRPTTSTQIRAGHMRTPYYANSDFLDVGIAYPWARPPQEVYGVPLSAYEGVDLIYRTPLGPISSEVQFYFGSAVESADDFTFRVDQTFGLIGNFSYGPVSVRLGYHMGDLNVSLGGDLEALPEALDGIGIDSVEVEDDSISYTSLALTYDANDIFAQAEFSSLTFDEFTAFSGTGMAITFGYRFSNLMPYVYYTSLETENEDELQDVADVVTDAVTSLNTAQTALDAYDPNDAVSRATTVATLNTLATQQQDSSLSALATDITNAGGGSQFAVAQVAAGLASSSDSLQQANNELFLGGIREQTSFGLGLRYDVTPKAALKFEIQQIGEFGDVEQTKGLFQDFGDDRDDVTLYSIILNAVF